jgi:hypothetical protein
MSILGLEGSHNSGLEAALSIEAKEFEFQSHPKMRRRRLFNRYNQDSQRA